MLFHFRHIFNAFSKVSAYQYLHHLRNPKLQCISVTGIFPVCGSATAFEQCQRVVHRDQAICFSMDKESRARHIGDDVPWWRTGQLPSNVDTNCNIFNRPKGLARIFVDLFCCLLQCGMCLLLLCSGGERVGLGGWGGGHTLALLVYGDFLNFAFVVAVGCRGVYLGLGAWGGWSSFGCWISLSTSCLWCPRSDQSEPSKGYQVVQAEVTYSNTWFQFRRILFFHVFPKTYAQNKFHVWLTPTRKMELKAV